MQQVPKFTALATILSMILFVAGVAIIATMFYLDNTSDQWPKTSTDYIFLSGVLCFVVALLIAPSPKRHRW